MSPTVILKFISGQEILAKLVSEDEKEYHLANPLTLQPQQVQNPKGPGHQPMISVGLIPFSWGSKADAVSVSKAHVLCRMEPEDELRDQYATITTGLIVASPQIKLAS